MNSGIEDSGLPIELIYPFFEEIPLLCQSVVLD